MKKGPHIHGSAVHTNASPEERAEAQLIAGFAYFENGKARFPQAYNELIGSIAVTAFVHPQAFRQFLQQAMQGDMVKPSQFLALAAELESFAGELRESWKKQFGEKL